jgi:hypothetical protein
VTKKKNKKERWSDVASVETPNPNWKPLYPIKYS